jgi:hypothetical protein
MKFAAGLMLVILSMGMIFAAEASPVSRDTAEQAVFGWLEIAGSPLQTSLGSKIASVESFGSDTNTPYYYVVDLAPQGFVIVAGDDSVEPIIAFAPNGKFVNSTNNPLGALVINDIPARIKYVSASIAAVSPLSSVKKAGEKWSMLLGVANGTSGITPQQETSIEDERVSPLLQTAWSQRTASFSGPACYNYYTPPYAAGTATNYPCGCVATAMSQVMRYWNYPVAGVGTASFTIKVDGTNETRNLRGGDGAGGPYSWDDMVYDPDSSITTNQCKAIGALCADAGTSVGMSYTSGGSGSVTLDAADKLKTVFKYANAVAGYNSGNDIGLALIDMVNPCLDSGSPVILGLSGSSGGHAIVCDGYGYNAATLYHHLNMGWGGFASAWYNLPIVDAEAYDFDTVDECVYNIMTNGSGEIISGRATDVNGGAVDSVVVTASDGSGTVYTNLTNVRGIYAFASLPSDTAFTLHAEKQGYVFADVKISTAKSKDWGAVSGNKWGADFVNNDPAAPHGFAAMPHSESIDLAWSKNASNDDVMVAWSSTGTFGTPSGDYASGDPISGGGTVLYIGGATNISHTNLLPQTEYFYKAWSVLPSGGYSTGVGAAARTFDKLPFFEGFDQSGGMPAGWSQEFVSGSVSWEFQSGGNQEGHPAAAYEGSNNACLFVADHRSDHKTRLITPVVECETDDGELKLDFWHCMEIYLNDQDELRVYYQRVPDGSWVLMQTYTNSVADWTERTLTLSNTGRLYRFAFEGNAKYGYGVCVDSVAITHTPPPVFVITSGVSGNGSITPTASVPAGSSPVFYISPALYNSVSNVMVDSVNIGRTNSYTFVNVITNHSIYAEFVENIATNGTPEAWLASFGWTNNFDQAALADADGDGLATWQEYAADTIPVDSNSVLRISLITESNGVCSLGWQGGSNAWQVLEVCSNLNGGTADWVSIITNAPPTGLITNISLGAKDSARFYRIRAWR